MAKDPAFLFYSNDFLAGTFAMSDEQVGKYIRLLCMQHQKFKLTKKEMISICKSQDEEIFSKFNVDENGFYFNDKLRKEAVKRAEYTQSRRDNANQRDLQGLEEKPTEAYAVHMEIEDVIVNEDDKKIITARKTENWGKQFLNGVDLRTEKNEYAFDVAFNFYPKKDKNIQKHVNEFRMQIPDLKTYKKLIDSIRYYKSENTKPIQYLKNFTDFLKCYNDYL